MIAPPTQKTLSLAQAPVPQADIERKALILDAWKREKLGKLACRADLWYNRGRNIVASAMLETSRGRIHRYGRCIMDTIPQDNTPRKQCHNPDCQQWLPATSEYFHRNRKAKDGLQSKCKKCCAAYNVLNREHISDYAKAHYARPEVQQKVKANEQARRNNPETREDFLAKKRASWNRPERQAHLKEYYQRPEVKEMKRANEKRRHSNPVTGGLARERRQARTLAYQARKQSISGSYTFKQIQDVLKRQKHRCYYAACGYAKFEKKNGKYAYHIDHTFPISRVAGTDIPANDISYLVLACPTCNMRKGNKFPWEFPEGGRLF
jgi:hypothetical protein